MSEKVLGVKCGVGREDFLRSAFMGAVVPVVSIEWLEKECNNYIKKANNSLKQKPVKLRGSYILGKRFMAKYLLTKAKKEVKK